MIGRRDVLAEILKALQQAADRLRVTHVGVSNLSRSRRVASSRCPQGNKSAWTPTPSAMRAAKTYSFPPCAHSRGPNWSQRPMALSTSSMR